MYGPPLLSTLDHNIHTLFFPPSFPFLSRSFPSRLASCLWPISTLNSFICRFFPVSGIIIPTTRLGPSDARAHQDQQEQHFISPIDFSGETAAGAGQASSLNQGCTSIIEPVSLNQALIHTKIRYRI